MTSELSAHRQRGVTAIGWVFLLLPIFLLGYVAMRCISPVSNYMAVNRALDNFAKDNAGNGGLTKDQLKDYLSRKWVVEYIDRPDVSDLTITRKDGGWQIDANYEQVVPLFYNVSLLFEFEKSVEFK
jgi:hypothetical protein